MKKTHIIFLMVIIVLSAGCTSQSGQVSPLSPEPTPVFTTLPSTQMPVSVTITPSISPEQTKQPVFSRQASNANFMNIAFGYGPSYLIKWDDPVVKIGISGNSDADYQLIEGFVNNFNNHSVTTHATLYEDANQPVAITFVPESFLDQAAYDRDPFHPTDFILKSNLTDKTLLIRKTLTDRSIYQEKIYINADSGNSRNYSVMRGILLALGFPGYSEHEDSLFYPDTDTASALSTDDWRAVDMMYNMDFRRNDTTTQVKNKLNY